MVGVGGMGVVVAAKHVELEDEVALKFMLPAAAAMPEAVGGFCVRRGHQPGCGAST